ncbi:hypothetical protein K458DRAFT_317558 [Lentithecium fluviatile CBS 122367]|uniref:Zn(2)-C6 fungal-type domain-containing protein n=1 Tax=Lentithecium fluviatile CBS 122367 TaxID=1168545 RepID=A0A6G1IJ13_9PLEO|nr:hypothetical protein K458DRAFT_317558 [Lentithecium fluviatile CBS 122367]
MDDLDDELDLRYHRGLKPEVYYRCPSTESLDGALRNELEKSATSLIPVEIVTEFVFALQSTITVPMTQQSHLDALFHPADYPQSITVDHALCRSIDGKERLKLQRAIARSFIETIQDIDGFKYAERQAWNKDGSDGTRFKYVCADSLQNRDRKNNLKKEKGGETTEDEVQRKRKGNPELATYDCGGSIHIKFSTKRDAINVVYKHNPIHRDVESRPAKGNSTMPAFTASDHTTLQDATNGTSNGTKPCKRRRSKKDHVAVETEFDDPDLDMSTSPEAIKTPAKKKRKKSATSPEAGRTSSTKKVKKGKQPQSPSKACKKTAFPDDSPPPVQLVKGKCLRCREKGIKCNEAKPTCNQCRRGLWTCQYEQLGSKKRSKNGCLNCRGRKRKCTEERPSCAYCLKNDDECEYTDYA